MTTPPTPSSSSNPILLPEALLPHPTQRLGGSSRHQAGKAVPQKYVELLGRTNFSFLQAASHPEEMAEQAIRLGYSGLGLCDRNGLYGIVRGYQRVQSPSFFEASPVAHQDFKYLVGAEMHLLEGPVVCLMPITKEGYRNLCRLITLSKRDTVKTHCRLSLADVLRHHQDLYAFYLPPWLAESFQRLQDVFRERLFVPVVRDATWEAHHHWLAALTLEAEKEAQLVVSLRPLMHVPERKPLLDVLTCVLHHTTIGEAKTRLLQNRERYLKPLAEVSALWEDRPQYLARTCEIAATVEFSLAQLRYRYPRSQLPAQMSIQQWLRHLVQEGLRQRYGQQITEKIQQQVDYELALIGELEYEDYFLTLREICDFARNQKILFQGRGSAANSIVCFALGLTAVDAGKHEVMFERFISKERHEPPDIDIDFEHERREEVIQYIYEKYGLTRAAMVCTVIRYRSRMAFREVAKVFDVRLEHVNEMIKYMGRDGFSRLNEDPTLHQKWGIAPRDWQFILLLTRHLIGFPRHLGIHSGGFLISEDPIEEIVPVERATMENRYVIQWNKDDVNTLGLMKVDVLALGMLSALSKTLKLLQQHYSTDWDLASIPADDQPTYEMVGRADTIGVFQIESRAQMQTLPRMKPKNFYDLAIEVALIRPGPLQGGMVHPYLRRRRGEEPVTYPHENLKPILQRTLGVPIFQEQVMKVCVVAAGFTGGEADELRRIMSAGWVQQGLMQRVRERILSGLQKHGLSQEYAEQIYRTIEGFSSYGFPESHALSFALLTYASCYFKKHYPAAFVCALLNSQPMGFYPPRVLIADLQRHGGQVLELDVQNSHYDYTLEAPAPSEPALSLRVGFRSLAGVAKKFLMNIEQVRVRDGPFSSLQDFVRRTLLPKSVLVKLAASGAFACFSQRTRDLLWHLESIQLDQNSFHWGITYDRTLQIHSVADGNELDDDHDARLIPFESEWATMKREYGSKGYSVTRHPLSILRTWLGQRNEELRKQRYIPYFSSQELNGSQSRHQAKLRVAGLVSATQRPPTAKGFCFMTLEDEFGSMNIVISPDVYQKERLVIHTKALLEVQGIVEKSGEIVNIRAEKVLALAGW